MGQFDELLDEERLNAFDRQLAGWLRSDQHDRVDTELTALMRRSSDSLTAICLETSRDSVRFNGWRTLNDRILALTAAGTPITAIGIDISAHGGGPADGQGRIEPALETNFYTDRPSHVFTGKSRDALLACSEGGATPGWIGSFVEIDYTMSVSGLAAMHQAIEDYGPRRQMTGDDASRRLALAGFLARWYRMLRLHQAVVRDLSIEAIAGGLPILVGTNEVFPFVEHVYVPSLTSPLPGGLVAPAPAVDTAPVEAVADADTGRDGAAIQPAEHEGVEPITETAAWTATDAVALADAPAIDSADAMDFPGEADTAMTVLEKPAATGTPGSPAASFGIVAAPEVAEDDGADRDMADRDDTLSSPGMLPLVTDADTPSTPWDREPSTAVPPAEPIEISAAPAPPAMDEAAMIRAKVSQLRRAEKGTYGDAANERAPGLFTRLMRRS